MRKQFQLLLSMACLGMGIGVVAGAVGAHLLEGTLSPKSLIIFNKAVFYQIIHCLGLFGLALYGLSKPSRFILFCGYAFIVGVILFSGSLYQYALSSDRFWAQITPYGGMTWILTWLSLAGLFFIKAIRDKS